MKVKEGWKLTRCNISGKSRTTRKLEPIYIVASLGMPIVYLKRRSVRDTRLLSKDDEALDEVDESYIPDEVWVNIKISQLYLETSRKQMLCLNQLKSRFKSGLMSRIFRLWLQRQIRKRLRRSLSWKLFGLYFEVLNEESQKTMFKTDSPSSRDINENDWCSWMSSKTTTDMNSAIDFWICKENILAYWNTEFKNSLDSRSKSEKNPKRNTLIHPPEFARDNESRPLHTNKINLKTAWKWFIDLQKDTEQWYN